VNASRRDWRLVAGVVVMLVALIVSVACRARTSGLATPDHPRAASTAVATDETPVASGLAVAGRVALPGPAAAVAVGEGAVWVLLEQGSLLRVDPDRHQVTGRLELGATSGGMPMGPWDVRVGPLAGGPARALRVASPYARGLHGGGILLRVGPVAGRAAGWLRDPS
jgi:hypothetical protein